jgi:hypothetical protein
LPTAVSAELLAVGAANSPDCPTSIGMATPATVATLALFKNERRSNDSQSRHEAGERCMGLLLEKENFGESNFAWLTL